MALSRFVLPYADVGAGIRPSSGAKLFFYATGTSTPKSTFTDATGSTANTNPVIANANGVFPAIFFNGSFNVALKDSNDVQIWTADPVNSKEVGTVYATTLDLIASEQASNSNDIVECQGYTTKGDGGGAQWKQNGVTGQTASQSPTQLGDALLNDGNGNQWALIYGKTLILEKLGGVLALQAALSTNAAEISWFTSSLNLEAKTYTLKSGVHLHGPGIEKSTLNVNATHPIGAPVFQNADTSNTGERVAKNIKISGFTIDGSLWSYYQPWLTNSNGTSITNPEFDYTGAGIIGLGGDIFDVVAADRRNPNYNNSYTVINLLRCERAEVFNVKFSSNVGFGVADAGGLENRVHNCTFFNHGKIDDISSGVWVQSSGNPDSPTASYADTEGHVTEKCDFYCKRSAITLAPTKGGVFRFNNIYESGESSVFSSHRCNSNGGSSSVHNNVFYAPVVTDITSHHLEADCSDYKVYNNQFWYSDLNSVNINGCSRTSVVDNDFYNCVTLTTPTVPYGPFSERYAFGIGTTPTAGNAQNSEISVINAGIQKDTPALNCRIENNNFNDDRATSLANYIIRLSRTGTVVNTCKDFIINNNDFSRVVDATPPKISVQGSVMATEMSLQIKNNFNHPSEAPVVVALQKLSGATGVDTFDIGFRPSYIEIYAALNNDTVANGQISRAAYSRTSTDSAVLVMTSTDGSGQRIGVKQNQIIRILDSSGANKMVATLASWNPTGFSINTTQIDATVNINIMCHP
jgi:hypothetical protein